MASKLFPATPRSKSHRNFEVPVDNKTMQHGSPLREGLPKMASDRRVSRTINTETRRNVNGRGFDLQQVQDDLMRTQEQLGLIEISKSNLMQDLARAKKNVEQLSSKLNEVNETSKREKQNVLEVEFGNVMASEHWKAELDAMKQRYEAALIELRTNKQALETLKHELFVCVEAKDEAVRLAGEAMSAAESTARRVEELSAELITTKTSLLTVDSATARMDELMDELIITRQNLLEANKAREKIAQEGAALLADKEAGLREITESANQAKAEIESLKKALAEAKDSEAKLEVLNSNIKALESDLWAAKEGEWKASSAAAATQAELQKVELEKQQAKNSEQVALSMLTKVSKELEEAQESYLKATLEISVLISSLEFVKAEFEKGQFQVSELRNRENDLNLKLTEFNHSLLEYKNKSQEEISALKDKETSALGKIELLLGEIERQKLELEAPSGKENSLIFELESTKSEMIRLQEEFTNKINFLSNELDKTQLELQGRKEREAIDSERISSLMSDLENKQSEVHGLQNKVSEMEVVARSLSAEVSSLTENNKGILDKLKESEADAHCKITGLNTEVSELTKALEEFSKAEKTAKEDLKYLHTSLQRTVSKADRTGEDSQEKSHCGNGDMELPGKTGSDVLNEELEEPGQTKKMDDTASARLRIKELTQTEELAKEEIVPESAIGNVSMDEIENLRKELLNTKQNEEAAKAACEIAENKLRDALKEIEYLRSKEMYLDSPTLAVPVDVADLKMKVTEYEKQLATAMAEVTALKITKEALMKELEDAKAEKEQEKKAVIEARQFLIDTEKAKLVMEKEIQKLLDDSKLWKSSKENSKDIQVHTEMNSTREEKPLPDSPMKEINVTAVVDIQNGDKKPDVTEKVEETKAPIVIASGQDVKKKKKALFHRFHSYLDKKKHLQS